MKITPALILALLSSSMTLDAMGPTSPQERAVEQSLPQLSIMLKGSVLGVRGVGVADALVMSSNGGTASTDASGNFRLNLFALPGARSVELTVVGAGARALSAKTKVSWSLGMTEVILKPLQLQQAATPSPAWLPTFGGEPGFEDTVYSVIAFDDGSGDAIYAAGDFEAAGGVPANRIARWDGLAWNALEPVGFDGTIFELIVFDDGNGGALYAGGRFSMAGGVPADNIAKWDGASWSAVGGGLVGGGSSTEGVVAMYVFDDGGGQALFAGGFFDTAGSVAALNVAKWNGSTWAALGAGWVNFLNPVLRDFGVFDDGGGASLYACGTYFDGVTVFGVAKWTGLSWVPIPGLSSASSIEVFDDGTGSALYVNGRDSAAISGTIAKWDGLAWTTFGTGFDAAILELEVFNDGNGDALYAGGIFTTTGGVAANYIAMWDGSGWSALDDGLGGDLNPNSANTIVLGLDRVSFGGQEILFVHGEFQTAGGDAANNLAQWNGSAWSALGPAGVSRRVEALCSFDDGTGPALYAGGSFIGAGGLVLNGVGRWDGTQWNALGSGADLHVIALTSFDDGFGPALYAGGSFTSIGGIAASRIAKWDGANWSPLGSGLDATAAALTVYDDGTGAALYAGGDFTLAGGVAAQNIARWDGFTWSPVGGGTNGSLQDLEVFDDGTGAALFVTGSFTDAGGNPINHVAKWDGASWSALGTGFNTGSTFLFALAAFDSGSGPKLAVGGLLLNGSGAVGSNVVTWDGTTWAALGSGVDNILFSMTAHDDGSGEALYVGGIHQLSGGVMTRRVSKWDGSNWFSLGAGIGSPTKGAVFALESHDDGSGPALYVGGLFSISPAGDSYLAKWGAADTTAPVITCPAKVRVPDPLFSSPGEVVEFAVSATDDTDPSPTIVSSPASGSFFARGRTLVTSTATDASGNQSQCQFYVEVGVAPRRN